MAQITAASVKELRDRTLAGMADCKKALEETSGDMEKAADWLRKKGITKAGQNQSRVATEGSVSSYIHMGGKIGVLLEVNCQTDFVARTDDFKNFCKDVAMHIAGRDPFPLYVSDEEIPAAQVEKERTLQLDKAREAGKGKPENIIAKIVDGSILKWKKDICLLDQEFVKDPTKDIRTLMLEISAKTGEKITVRRFTRYALGEGLQKKEVDFAKDVADQVAASSGKA
ncbi:MAG TPA: translation elongation factor Ts [Pseudomonadota bacterium]|nr:translation elongation factor Ts [Pseudomonadota bacterium]